MDRQPIISAKDVEITFSLRGRKLNAIRKCSLDLYEGETLAIVGESGSGKSVFTKTFVGMLDANGKITGGSIMFEGRDMTKFTEKDWLGVRGKKIAMVMQDPMTSLNPLKKIGKQIQESIEHHQGLKGEAAKKAAEAARFAKEQEAAGIAAVGQAEAEAIRAKALAEAEGIDKKAEAMKKYGEAAVIEMIMNALPEIAKNVAEPLSKVDKITMYGEGNSAKLLSDIVNGTTQVTEGISAGMGLDLKSLLAGALGGKLAAGNSQPVQVTVAPQAQPDVAAASADTPEQQV